MSFTLDTKNCLGVRDFGEKGPGRGDSASQENVEIALAKFLLPSDCSVACVSRFGLRAARRPTELGCRRIQGQRCEVGRRMPGQAGRHEQSLWSRVLQHPQNAVSRNRRFEEARIDERRVPGKCRLKWRPRCASQSLGISAVIFKTGSDPQGTFCSLSHRFHLKPRYATSAQVDSPVMY
jgi:hypothetical protein